MFTKNNLTLRVLPAVLFVVMFAACNNNNTATTTTSTTDSLTDAQKRMPENGLKGLDVFEGLEVHTMATEPMLKNPTNMDVDERGRVWITEAYNYRPAINGNPTNPLGDRIMVLEDNNGDGIMDTGKVFYQGPEINAPLGICVLGNKVLVSQSPNVWVFTDDNGDDKADKKELLFTGIDGDQHDHGMHTFTFGPDGKLYFNFGNEGKQLKDKNGKPVLDQDGEEIGPKKYTQGMVFRCDPDGTHVECLGQNFRNPYEVAVDSYTQIWQSDNDDDGNRGVRINYVMDYGNYGYVDEMTRAGWSANRTNIEDSIPYRHWHLNDPGAMPNLLQTGSGSPTGILVYEGKLLPKEFYGQIIHSDAGPNVVRSYSVEKDGAGYTAKIINILKGDRDQWFRPADVCIAPDGSLIVADWYDPGVGGHQAGDQTKGRIYRVAPKDSKYSVPKQDYSTPAGAVAALQSPNLSTRYHAFTTLQTMGAAAIPELEKLWKSGDDSRMRARAFWALVKMPGGKAQQYIDAAIKDGDANIRITGIRAARELNANVIGVVTALAYDKDEAVRRECILALHHNKAPEAATLWATLAREYDGKDRWYLEALGIGADRQWDAFFKAWLIKTNNSPLQSAADRDIVWRARTDEAVPYLAQLATDNNTPLNLRLRYFRAFDFNNGPLKNTLLVKMIEDNKGNDVGVNKLVLHALDVQTVLKSPVAQTALTQVLASIKNTPEYIELVSRYQVKTENPNLLQLAIDSAHHGIGRNAAGTLLAQGGGKLAWDVINGKDTARAKAILSSLGGVGSKESIDMVTTVALSNKYNMDVRKQAANVIGHSWDGEARVLSILKDKKVPKELIPDVVASVNGAWRQSVRTEAQSYLPNSGPAAANKKAPSIADINALTGDATKGKTVFMNTCSLCHMVAAEGNDFGPKLTEIGSKYPKEGLLNAIVKPSEGISFGFEGWVLNMKDKSVLSGIIASKTETDIDLKLPGGSKQHIKTSDVASMKEMKESMMPEGLYNTMSTQDMANLLAYLEGLKKK